MICTHTQLAYERVGMLNWVHVFMEVTGMPSVYHKFQQRTLSTLPFILAQVRMKPGMEACMYKRRIKDLYIQGY